MNGIENILGSQNNDVIVGDDFNNTLSSFAGSGTITGGSGNSTLTGGSGADAFALFFLGDPKTETITDFSSAEGDKINFAPGFSPASLDQFFYNPGDDTLSFNGNGMLS